MTGRRLTVDLNAIVVLDIDDTLYLEREYVRSGFEAVGQELARSHGCRDMAAHLWADFEAGTRGDTFDRALRQAGIEPTSDLVAHLIDRYRTHKPAISLLDDARRFLERVGRRPKAAITDGPGPSQRAKASALGLDEQLDLIVVTVDLGPGLGKPAPDAYLLVEQAFSAGPERCWYIADNPAKDFVVPLARGWQPVRIRRPGSLHEMIDTPKGVAEILSLDEIGINPAT